MHDRPLDARRYAGLAGIAFALLFGVGSAIWGLDMPTGGTPAAEVAEFYSDTADRIVIGASLSLLAIAAFVLFASALRQVLVDAGGEEFLATTALGGAGLGLAAGIGAETINMMAALRARDGELSDALAQSLFETSQILGSTATGIGIGVFALATATVALRTGRVLPRWIALLTLVVGVAMLTPLNYVNVLPGAAMVLLSLLIGGALLRRDPLPASAP